MTNTPPACPSDIRWDAPLERTSIATLLDRAAQRWPDASAIEFMGRSISYAELDDETRRLATGLRALGVGPGVHVGLYLPNTPHFVVAFFAVLRLGAVVVNYSPLDAERTLAHKIADSATTLMITLDLAAMLPLMQGLVHGECGLRKLIVGSLGDHAADPAAVRGALERAAQLAPLNADDQRYAALLANDGSAAAHVVADPATELAVLQYTGGTTGSPKGAMLTHANLSVACDQLWWTARGTPPLLVEGRERVLGVLPLFHIYALTVNLLFGVRIGAQLVLHTRFEPEAALRELAARRITVFPAVPTMFAALVNHAQARHHDLTALKFCGSGGAPLPEQLDADFRRLTHCPILEGWGMTETAASGTFTPHSGGKTGSCGIARPGVELRLLDLADATRAAAPDAPGELAIRGPNVMTGYWRQPEATAAAFTADGFFRTGDVARIDDAGWVFIVDRCKDMLLVSGFNVYPRNIEEAVMQHPAVAEVIVIGMADPYRGQAPKAFVVLKPDSPPLTLAGLQSFLQRRVGRHEMPLALELRASLPRTPVGKLSRKALQDELAGRAAG